MREIGDEARAIVESRIPESSVSLTGPRPPRSDRRGVDGQREGRGADDGAWIRSRGEERERADRRDRASLRGVARLGRFASRRFCGIRAAARSYTLQTLRYNGTPLNWCNHGSLNCHDPRANHAEVARLLLAAGARVPEMFEASDEVAAVLRSHDA